LKIDEDLTHIRSNVFFGKKSPNFYFIKTLATIIIIKGFQFKSPKNIKWQLETTKFWQIINLNLPIQTLLPFKLLQNCENGGH
jgi:hypothetical protein